MRRLVWTLGLAACSAATPESVSGAVFEGSPNTDTDAGLDTDPATETDATTDTGERSDTGAAGGTDTAADTAQDTATDTDTGILGQRFPYETVRVDMHATYEVFGSLAGALCDTFAGECDCSASWTGTGTRGALLAPYTLAFEGSWELVSTDCVPLATSSPAFHEYVWLPPPGGTAVHTFVFKPRNFALSEWWVTNAAQSTPPMWNVDGYSDDFVRDVPIDTGTHVATGLFGSDNPIGPGVDLSFDRTYVFTFDSAP